MPDCFYQTYNICIYIYVCLYPIMYNYVGRGPLPVTVADKGSGSSPLSATRSSKPAGCSESEREE